jgi:phosphoserine phosphatase
MVEEDARTHGHALEQCQAYSDSYSDLPMLSVVGHPFCIRPDRGLARLARAYSWPIIDIDQPSPGESAPRGFGGDS